MTDSLTINVNETVVALGVTGGETVSIAATVETVTVQATSVGTTVHNESVQVVTAAVVTPAIVAAVEIEVIELGVQGPPGVIVGGANVALSYTHTQATPSAAWLAYHQLNTKPVIDIEIGGEKAMGRVTYPSLNSALIEFNTPVTGTAKCVG